MNYREIDGLVAEKVMGWGTQKFKNIGIIQAYTEDDEISIPDDFCPTENIEDAWKVVDKMKDDRFTIVFTNGKYKNLVIFWENDLTLAASIYHESITTAICLAALKALGVEVSK
ncbi:BC1872 family protein [Gracilibacillus saliphilus]|uniref:BC1872 family protein n=1 Tax=Gracilibacillus saliphilus TaxID=543890 RepID=UPI0013CF7039|nr:hypothetical protein [Gracilibacillus saliphilus]